MSAPRLVVDGGLGRHRPVHLRWLPLAALIASCGGGGGGSSGAAPPPPVCTTPCAVTVSWTANDETAVNAAGGGYRVYYANAPGVALAQATQVTVSHDAVAGSTPTAVDLALTAGTWHVRVTAFSAINTGGSAPSVEAPVVVP